jgi:hypothetical protein
MLLLLPILLFILYVTTPHQSLPREPPKFHCEAGKRSPFQSLPLVHTARKQPGTLFYTLDREEAHKGKAC